jgi:hypothetical protein
MNLRDEEQLQKYFDRSMSSGEEQNFLIDVAARDEMRLAFRSQLELLKALRADKDAAILPAALVRNRTLAALGIGAAIASEVSKEKEVAHTAAMPLTSGSRLWSFLRRPAVMLSTGLLAGAATMYSVMPSNEAKTTTTSISKSAPSEFIISEPSRDTKQADMAPVAKSPAVNHITKQVAQAPAAVKNNDQNALPLVQKSKPGEMQVVTSSHKEDTPSK